MIMVNIDDKYTIHADKLLASRMLKECLSAAFAVAEDISVMTGKDPDIILQEALKKASSRDPGYIGERS